MKTILAPIQGRSARGPAALLRLPSAWRQAAALLLALAAAPAAALTLAVADVPHTAPLLIAEAQGYFAAEGLALQVIHCVNGRRCLQHLTDGQAHFATVAETPIVFASFTRRDFAIVATTTTSSRENRLLVRTDRGITRPATLQGKRIGILPGTSAQYFTDAFLLYHGIDRSQVRLVPLDPADPVGPLLRGEVDAAGLYQPHAYKAEQALGSALRALPSPPGFTVNFNLVAVPASAGASDADVAKLLRAVQRGMQLIETEPARARAIVAARLKLEPALLDVLWGDYDYALGLAQPLINTLEAQARWAQREGLVGRTAMPDYLDYLRPGPLQMLERRLVTVVK